MAVRYFIRYFDVVGVEHLLNIYDDTYELEAIQIDGNVNLTYSETDSSLEAIRGQGLSVELEADTTLTFNDLWSETEKTFKVEYLRDGNITFRGWLNPDGFFEDYVSTNWIVTFDCVDGLGYLPDLSFVEDATGFPFTGRKSYIEILGLALARTGLKQIINTSIDIRYTGLSESLDVLANTYANTDRYIKDDGETIMSCEDVIRDVLEPFGAVLTSLNGQWYVYKPNQLYLDSTAIFFRYNYQGIALNPEFYPPTETIDLSTTIGNNEDNFSLFHCSANQSIRNESSVGAYRISYKYGLVESLLDNYNLKSFNGISIDDWIVLNSSRLIIPIDSTGVRMITTYPNYVSVLKTRAIIINENAQAKININITIPYKSGTKIFPYQIFIADTPQEFPYIGGNVYYMQEDNSWGNVNEVNDLLLEDPYASKGITYNIERRTLSKPSAITGNGYLYVLIKTPVTSNNTGEEFCDLNFVKILPAQEDDNVIGEFHTFQRTTKPSAKVESIKEVATGDNVANIYLGTIYKNDALTPTETWNRKGFVEEKPLLQIIGEETLRINQLPTRVFSGDVFGYFNYLSVILIDGLSGVFMPIKYSYNTKNNIISAEFKQIYGDEVLDIDYKKTFDYGNTVKPTIK